MIPYNLKNNTGFQEYNYVTLLHLIFFLLLPLSIIAVNKSTLSNIWRENIEVYGINEGFRTTVTIQSIASRNDEDFSIYYSTFEKINTIDVKYYDKKKDKYRTCRGVKINDFQAPSGEFYTSDRIRRVGIPREVPFLINYETEVSDLILLPHIYFSSNLKIDTFYYSIKIPSDLNLKYKVENPGNLTYFKIDSSRVKSYILYSITGVVNKPEDYKRKHSSWDESVVLPVCIIKLVITPKEFKDRETAFVNDWIAMKLKPETMLNSGTMHVIDSLTKGIENKDSIARVLFDFVRSKIKYINIEIGYGAFVPNDVNQTLEHRQGDCKDKANLLCQAMIYKGMDARLVLTATTGHYTQMDFPCLGIANHMICALKMPSSWMFLDPTEETGVYGQSGLMTQGRMAFILGNDGGQFARIPQLSASQNMEKYVLYLVCHKDKVSGTFMINYRGKKMQQILSRMMNISPEEKLNYIKSYLLFNTRNLNYSQIRVIENKDSLSFIGNVIVANHIFIKSDTVNYLSLDFIPRPMDFISEDPLPGDIMLWHTLAKQVNIHMIFEKPIAHINLKSTDYNKDGYFFTFSSSSEKNLINIDYSFAYNDVIIPKETSDKYKQFKTLISNTFNNAIKFW
jgi:hypothetical protein